MNPYEASQNNKFKVEEFVLEQVRVQAQRLLSPRAFENLKALCCELEGMAKAFVVELSTEFLCEKETVVDEESLHYPRSWWDHLKLDIALWLQDRGQLRLAGRIETKIVTDAIAVRQNITRIYPNIYDAGDLSRTRVRYSERVRQYEQTSKQAA